VLLHTAIHDGGRFGTSRAAILIAAFSSFHFCCICDIYDFFVPNLNVLTYFLTVKILRPKEIVLFDTKTQQPTKSYRLKNLKMLNKINFGTLVASSYFNHITIIIYFILAAKKLDYSKLRNSKHLQIQTY